MRTVHKTSNIYRHLSQGAEFKSLADVTAFGADPSGTADASGAIQKALDSVSASGGGIVCIPAGRYRLERGIRVPPLVTLLGDPAPMGTVLLGCVPSSEDTACGLIELMESSGIRSLTVFYPDQSIDRVLPYPPTVFLPGGMNLRTVSDVLLVNAYIGIKAEYNESTCLYNVRGCCLKTGVEIDSVGDVGVFDGIDFSPCYWSGWPENPGPVPEESVLQWQKTHETSGLLLHDMEQQQFTRISITGYTYGILFSSRPTRFMGSGSFFDLTVRDCVYGLYAEEGTYESNCGYASHAYPILTAIDWRCGYAVSKASIEGERYSVFNGCPPVTWWYDGQTYTGQFRFSDVKLSGPTKGRFSLTSKGVPGSLASEDIAMHPTGHVFADAFETVSAGSTEQAIQNALDRIGQRGGGRVYLEAGCYSIRRGLRVPASTLLCGAAGSPQRIPNQGTVLVCDLPDCAESEMLTAPSLIRLEGNYSGIEGLYLMYDRVALAVFSHGDPPFLPVAVRGRGKGHSVLNCCICGPFYGVDFRDCPGHLIRNVVSGCLRHHYQVSGGRGTICNCLANGTVLYRTNGFLPMDETHIQEEFFDRFTRKGSDFIRVGEGSDEQIVNCFIYGGHHFLSVAGGQNVLVVNGGSDALGAEYLRLDGGSVTCVNAILTSDPDIRVDAGSLRMFNTMRNHHTDVEDVEITV